MLTAIVLAATLAPASPWRNEDGGFLPKSPLLDSIVFLVVAYFIVLGLTYGIVVGTLRSTRDAVAMMTESLKEMLPFVVLALALDRDELSDLRGILTPAAAMGDALLARFPAAHVSLEVSRLN